MDDPWDVKSVRLSGQYLSCMKINGVPLLPPVLSKECRQEMQYYKLLAKEVEKRISILQPYINSDVDSNEDKTDAPEIPECDLVYNDLNDNVQDNISLDVDQMTVVVSDKNLDERFSDSFFGTDLYNLSPEHMLVDTAEPITNQFATQDIETNFCVSINNNCNGEQEPVASNPPCPLMDLPERDYNCTNTRELMVDVEIESKNLKCNKQMKESILLTQEIVNFSFSQCKSKHSDLFDGNLTQNTPQMLSCKSFTGSLNNIHTESGKGAHIVPNLMRQQSYTVLNPSPQLLAHLEVQSVNLGVDMSSISMSESLSNLGTPSKKRRSWDLETAKVKWSKMAMELKEKNLKTPIKSVNRNQVKAHSAQRPVSPSRAKSVAAARTKYSSLSMKSCQKNDSIQRTRPSSPVRAAPSNRTIILEQPMSFRVTKESNPVTSVKETAPRTIKEPNKITYQKKEPKSPISKLQTFFEFGDNTKLNELTKSVTMKPSLISESEDPATKVRELYDKIQKQQLVQMASLVEKQKKEQMLLQQVFEEQNSLLYKQLKTICPKSPVEAKEAWVDKSQEADRGPVSLSQLINPKSPPKTKSINSPVTSTLTDSNKYINHCDNLLQKSRNISGSIKNQGKSQSLNGSQIRSPKTQPEGNHTRTNSPNRYSSPTSRRLNYDTSASSDRDYEPILTDRTNDTMADLNVTFPSDSEEVRSCSYNGVNRSCRQDVTVIHSSPSAQRSARSTDVAIKWMEQTIQNSINSSITPRGRAAACAQPTPKQQAAASRIVAHAKGYLVRRLMKTARVQATVQTIKDALLCALQLHQDREGIRGADVDLHRRLIQQITAACYSLHDTFIASSASERCAMIATDRSRRNSIASRTSHKHRHSELQQ